MASAPQAARTQRVLAFWLIFSVLFLPKETLGQNACSLSLQGAADARLQSASLICNGGLSGLNVRYSESFALAGLDSNFSFTGVNSSGPDIGQPQNRGVSFSGAAYLIIDGSVFLGSGPAPTAPGAVALSLSLAPANASGAAASLADDCYLLRFSKIENLELRNLQFSSVSVGPCALILIEDCAAVIVDGIRMDGGGTTGPAGAVLRTRRSPLTLRRLVLAATRLHGGYGLLLDMKEFAPPKVSTETYIDVYPALDASDVLADGVSVSGGGHVVSLSGCSMPAGVTTSLCNLRNLSFNNISVRSAAYVLHVEGCERVQVSNLTVSSAECDPTSSLVAFIETNRPRLTGLHFSNVHGAQQLAQDRTDTFGATAGPAGSGLLLGNSTSAVIRGYTVVNYTSIVEDASALLIEGGGNHSVSELTCVSSTAADGPCLRTRGSSGTLVVRNSTFLGTAAHEMGGYGGALYFEDCGQLQVNIIASYFSNMTAGYGGAIAARPIPNAASNDDPNLLYTPSCRISLSDSLFSNTKAVRGGSIFVTAESALSLTNTNITTSTAQIDGGAIWTGDGVLAVRRSRFVNCTATDTDGGAISYQSTSANNVSYRSIVLNGTVFVNSSAGGDGGALFLNLARDTSFPIDIIGGSFTGNAAKKQGGGVSLQGNCAPFFGAANCRLGDPRHAMRITGTRFDANNASLGGAVQHWYHRMQSLEITACTFLRNNASAAAAVSARQIPWVNVSGCVFEGNSAKVESALVVWSLHAWGRVHNTSFLSNKCVGGGTGIGSALYAGDQDGVVRADGTVMDMTVTNCTFDDNFSSSEGGGATFQRCGLVADNLLFRNNIAGRAGGGMCLEPDLSSSQVALYEGIQEQVTNATLSGIRFVNNTAPRQGGGLQITRWGVTMRDILFLNNSVRSAVASDDDYAGGGLHATDCPSPMQISDVVFEGNAAFQGGAIATELCSVEIRNATFLHHYVAGDGGAIRVIGSRTGNYTAELSEVDFIGNQAGQRGGALKALLIAVVATTANFFNNTAVYAGGALHMQLSPTLPADGQANNPPVRSLLSNASFSSNSAIDSGGAVYHVSSSLTIDNTTFLNNSAGDAVRSDTWSDAGGAIYGQACTAPALISACRFLGNRAQSRGGAIAYLSCGSTISRAEFRGNGAPQGGAIAAGHLATAAEPVGPLLNISESNLTLNTALEDRGGALDASGVKVALHSVLAVSNSARLSGGAVAVTAAPDLLVAGGTYAKNVAGGSGGALFADGCRLVTMHGVNLYGNSAQDRGGGLATLNVRCVITAASVFTANSATGSGGGIWIGMASLAATSDIDDSSCLPLGGGIGGQAASNRRSALAHRSMVSFTNITLLNNTASDSGTGIGSGGGLALESIRGAAWLEGLIAVGNTALVDGGALAVMSTREEVEIHVVGAELRGNRAARSGGAVACDGLRVAQKIFISHSNLSGNGAALGGALAFEQNTSADLHRVTLWRNKAGRNGGCIYASHCASLLMTNTNVSICEAEGAGGGVFAAGCSAVTAVDCILTSNVARSSEGGGAMFVSTAAPEITRLSILGGEMSFNTAGLPLGSSGVQTNTPSNFVILPGSGGALWVGGMTSAVVNGTAFLSNSAAGLAGAVAIATQCLSFQDLARLLVDGADSVPAAVPQGRGDKVIMALQASAAVAAASLDVGCFATVVVECRLWNNSARGSGGAVYALSQESLGFLCEGVEADASGPTASIASLLGRLPRSGPALNACFQPPQAIPPNKAVTGYGDSMALAPSQLVLDLVSDTAPLVLPTDPTSTSTEPSADDSSGPGSITTAGSDVGSRQLLTSSVVAAAAVGTCSGGVGQQNSTVALWRQQFVFEVDGVATDDPPRPCRLGQSCTLLAPSALPINMNVSVRDALDQLVTDDSVLSGTVVRVSVSSEDACQRPVDLLGNPTTQASQGIASLQGVRVRARKGNYTLSLTMSGASAEASPLVLNVSVVPCPLGDITISEGFECYKCPSGLYTLDWDGASNTTTTAASCYPCESGSICPGGAVIAPQEGYWHSNPGSVLMHACVNGKACREGDADSNDKLVRCQDLWYAYFGRHDRAVALAEGHINVAELVLSNVTLGADVDAFCALHGVSPDNPKSYMRMLCAQGYGGNLCATCQPVDGHDYAGNVDFECEPCPSAVWTVLVAISMFLFNTLVLAFVVLSTFLADMGGEEEEGDGVESLEILKVIILHFNHFLIITRLGISWPEPVIRLQGVVGSATGSVMQVYAPSCFWKHASSATQAGVQVLSGLLLPLASVFLVLALWMLRYYLWNQAALHGSGRQADAPAAAASSEGNDPQDGLDPIKENNGSLPAKGMEYTNLDVPPEGETILGQNSRSDSGGIAAAVPYTTAVRGLTALADGCLIEAGGGGYTGNSGSVGVKPAHVAIKLADDDDVLEDDANGNTAHVDGLGLGSSAWPPRHWGIMPAQAQPQQTFQPQIIRFDAAQSLPHRHNPLYDEAGDDADGGEDDGRGSVVELPSGEQPGTPAGGQDPEKGEEDVSFWARMFSVFRHGVAMVDATIPPGSQMLMVLMVAPLVLLPNWATEALSIFACYQIDNGSGNYPENQMARSESGWWIRDMDTQCYKGTHLSVWVPVGVVAVAILCLAVPLAGAVFLLANRHRLQERAFIRTHGFLYRRYKEKFYLWELVMSTQTMALVVTEVFGRTLPVFQHALLLQIILLAVLLINLSFRPLKQDFLSVLESLSLGVIVLTLCMGTFFTNPDEPPTRGAEVALGAAILLVNCGYVVALIGIYLYVSHKAWHRGYHLLRKKLYRVKLWAPQLMMDYVERITQLTRATRATRGENPLQEKEQQQEFQEQGLQQGQSEEQGMEQEQGQEPEQVPEQGTQDRGLEEEEGEQEKRQEEQT